MKNFKRMLLTAAMPIMAVNAYAWHWSSPYVYCMGNPVSFIDPDGQKIVFVNGYLGFGSPNGGATYWNGTNSSFVRGHKPHSMILLRLILQIMITAFLNVRPSHENTWDTIMRKTTTTLLQLA